MESSEIAVRFEEGKMIRGYTQNSFPNLPVFHVLPMDAASKTEPVEIRVSELKAVFFVRNFTGNKGCDDRKILEPREEVQRLGI